MAGRRSILPAVVMAMLVAVYAFHQAQRKQAAPPANPPAVPASPASTIPRAAAGWTRLENPRLVEWGGNDGDSFRIRHAGGQETYRLYFVDTPEKSRTFPDRLEHQSRYFDNLPVEAVIAAGEKARDFTLALLRSEPFEVWTRGERVMDSDRLHAMVRLPGRGNRWLDEDLVMAGLARIYTLPADLPDGTPKQEHLRSLKERESRARKEARGAWAR